MDLNAVVTYVAEKRAGRSPRPNIYKRREIRQREVAVMLLADMSTSIMQHLPEGGGRLVDRVRAGVLLFAESMEEVGDAYSIAGFCSKYRDNVSYYKLKGFDELLSEDIRAQIGGMSGRHAHGGEGGGGQGRASVLHHRRHHGEPVPAADFRSWALPGARPHQQPAQQAAGDLSQAAALIKPAGRMR
jgi:hypothetical protein